MKVQITTSTGKTIEIPSRMFRQEDLDAMDISHVEQKFFFNKAKHDEPLKNVSSDVQDNMGIIDYPDCSRQRFSEEKLNEVIARQLKSKGDYLFLPYFKKETQFDVRKKLEVAAELRKRTNKDIILEIHYTSQVPTQELVNAQDDFDYLAIHYGTHFGRLPSFSTLCVRLLDFKIMTGKKVFCMAVPMMFAGERNQNNSYLMPVWGLISDGWAKNWKSGGSLQEEIRLVDPKDHLNKDLQGWLENGHTPDGLVGQVGVTVFSLFSQDETKEAKEMRNTYKIAVQDEFLTEIENLSPSTIDSYLWRYVPVSYHSPIIQLYREKMLQQNVRQAEWMKSYSEDDRRLIEDAFRKHIGHPVFIVETLEKVKELLSGKKVVLASEIVKVITPQEERF